MLYLLKKGTVKTFETRRGIAYNAKVCNKDGTVIGDVDNQGSGGGTDIWVDKEFRDQWRADLTSKGYEAHHEESLAEWMFDVDEGAITPYPTEIPTYDEIVAWEEIKYNRSEIKDITHKLNTQQVKTAPEPSKKTTFEFYVDWHSVMVEVEADDEEQAEELAYKKVMDNLKEYQASGFQLDGNNI
jgi:hypothetical protein